MLIVLVKQLSGLPCHSTLCAGHAVNAPSKLYILMRSVKGLQAFAQFWSQLLQ